VIDIAVSVSDLRLLHNKFNDLRQTRRLKVHLARQNSHRSPRENGGTDGLHQIGFAFSNLNPCAWMGSFRKNRDNRKLIQNGFVS